MIRSSTFFIKGLAEAYHIADLSMIIIIFANSIYTLSDN